MSAFLKAYTDSGHTTEVAHTTQNTTTSTGSQAAGTTAFNVGSTANMPAQGSIDIIDGANGNETLQYSSIASSTQLNLTKPTAFLHTGGQTVNQWYYVFAVGDQTNGIVNDGTMATPQSPTNVATYYIYNAGDQAAQNCSFATSNTGVTTPSGFADTLLSITSATSGYAASVSPANIAAGAQQQLWVVAEIPNQQSAIGNPQICLISLNYQSI